MIYHILTEEETFSEVDGGAISRWVANMARGGDSVVVCRSQDNTWGFPSGRVISPDRWRRHGVLKGRSRRWPLIIRHTMLRWIFSDFVSSLKKNDIVWIHNRPEYAGALRPMLDSLGVHTVLHMHNSFLCDLMPSEVAPIKDIPHVFCSSFLAEQARAIHPETLKRSYVLYNGADGRLFYPRPARVLSNSSVPVILFVGRLVPHKGVQILIKAMTILAHKGVQVKCKVIGAANFGCNGVTPFIETLRESLPSNVCLLGYKAGRELAKEFRDADVFCCPSLWQEPLGMVNLEAMASGIPVVASNVGGIPEVLRFGGGVLLEPGEPEVLAEALYDLVTNKDKRLKLGAEALQVFENHFSWDVIRTNFTSIMKDIRSCS